MFTFAFETDGVVTFIQGHDEHVYTWPTEKTARELFGSGKRVAHLYQLDLDLSVARLIAKGDNTLGCPAEIYPDDVQKTALYASFVYKSLLEWAPIEEFV